MPNLTVYPSGEVIHLAPGQTVLEGLFAAGYSFTVGCKRGGCAICKVDVRSGQFHYNRPVADTVIDAVERVDGTCLTCRAVPDGDLTIEMREHALRCVNPLLRQLNDRARRRASASPSEAPAGGG